MESKTPQSSSSSSLQEKKKTSYELRPEAELRLEVGSTPIDIILESGTAEAFGVELFIKKVYTVESTSIAIFSYHGCKLEIHGTPTSAYVSNDTPMLSYLNVHDGLEKMRRASETEGSIGPRIMIVGQTDTGKSTIARILCNYAVRAGWQPVYVDVDVGQSSISIPGVIGATPVEHLIGGDDLVHHTIKSVSSLFFGHSSPGPNVSLYNSLCKRLATTVEKRLERKDCPARASGVVINTAGWVDGEGYDVLMNIAQSFQVDIVLVVDNERLTAKLRDDPASAAFAVAHVAKSGGVVPRSSDARAIARGKKIHSYFYGPQGNLAPREKLLTFNKVSIFSTSPMSHAPLTALPIGEQSLVARDGLQAVVPSNDLVNAILAVSYASSSSDLTNATVAGYLHVKSVDVQARTLVVLAPTADPPPGHNRLLVGTLKWFDDK